MRIALISCVKEKQGHAVKAKDMYLSPLFRGMYRYAKKLNVDKIYILSAKYGLIDEHKVIEPYNVTLLSKTTKERKEWADKVLESLGAHCDLHNDEFVILAGSVYRQYLIRHLTNYTIPMEGLGIGRQLHFLKNINNKQLCITFQKD